MRSRCLFRPESLLPFKVTDVQVRQQIRRCNGSKWLAPNALKSGRALVDRVHGVYIPYWTFDAHVVCPWRADAGHYYYTSESYRDNQGRHQTRQVRHVRWEPASGEVLGICSTASSRCQGRRASPESLLKEIEPFPTGELVPYSTGYLSGFVVEHYRVVLLEAAEYSQAEMKRKLHDMCAQQVPGDTHRNLYLLLMFSGRTFKHVLVPVWLLTYNYGNKPWQVVVNGYTGRMAGLYPKSPWKVAGLVLVILIVVLVVTLMLSGE